MIEHARKVLSTIGLQQWLWFGICAILLMLADYLYNFPVHSVLWRKKIKIGIWRKAFVAYSGLILLVTLLSRKSVPEREPAFIPFWSWAEVLQQKDIGMLYDILLNILLFVPFGCLLKMAFGKIGLWTGWLVGFLLSMAIEVCQLAFHLGMFEWDDMLHNSLGCLIGCAAAAGIQRVLSRHRKG